MSEHEQDDVPGESVQARERAGLLISRRGALIGGSVGVGGLLGLGAIGVEAPAALAAAPIDGADAPTIALPTTTAPEQLRLVWGSDPRTAVTVSFSAPGTVPMPAPALAYSTRPITAANPGQRIALPAPEPLELSTARTGPSATSFTDSPSGETTYHYHVPLIGLEPDTTYHYEVTDGAPTPSTASGSFLTAPEGRAAYRFTAFGDQGTPYSGNPSGYYWSSEGTNDSSRYNTQGVQDPGDGEGPGLFHLMLGDLSYADQVPENHPACWRDWAAMVAASAAAKPWMPLPGNHEAEYATATTPTGSTPALNGPYGIGNYLARYLLPDPGLTNYDHTTLQGSFYAFQVGTVQFITLNSADVAWQSGQKDSAQYLYTGDLAPRPADLSVVPDPSQGTPNLQTRWLEQQLRSARAPGSGVDMIVVCHHKCMATSSADGNGIDMGIRAAWQPLFDRYEVDLVLCGHDHNYSRTYPLRGYDAVPGATASAAFTSPFGSYASGDPVNTRRPSIVSRQPTQFDTGAGWDTARGTVYLVLGGGGAASSVSTELDPSTGDRVAPVWAARGAKDANEDCDWQAYYDTSDAYGYAVFDVDPGDAPGETSIRFQWYSMPNAGDGDPVTPPTAPLEEWVFTRLGQQLRPGRVRIEGSPAVGETLSADPGNWGPEPVSFSYQWLANGSAISGATAQTYVPVAADLGQTLSVGVTGAASGYGSATATSPGVSVAEGTFTAGIVTVSGRLEAGASLTATSTDWTPSSAELSYQWLVNGSPVSGADQSSYVLSSSAVGQQVEVQISASAPGYAPAMASSVPLDVVSGQAPLTIEIAGTPAVNRTVRAVLDPGSDRPGAEYRWRRDGSEIHHADGPSYTLVPADAGGQLQVEVVLAGQGGRGWSQSPDWRGPRRGDAGAAISPALSVGAVDYDRASRPGWRGRAAVGETVVALAGSWSPKPRLDYRWLADGQPIPGADQPQLRIDPSLAGRQLSLVVRAARTGYRQRELSSDPVQVAPGTLAGAVPQVRGSARVGHALHVINGEWSPGVDFTYRWLADGRPIAGAGGITYVVRPADRSRRISVEVTGRTAGYAPLTRRSASTRAVRR